MPCLSDRLPKIQCSASPCHANRRRFGWRMSQALNRTDGKLFWRSLAGRLVAERCDRARPGHSRQDTAVTDITPPPAPTNLRVAATNKLGGRSRLESVLASFHHRARRSIPCEPSRASREPIRVAQSFKTCNTATPLRNHSHRCDSPTPRLRLASRTPTSSLL